VVSLRRAVGRLRSPAPAAPQPRRSRAAAAGRTVTPAEWHGARG